MRNCDSIRRPFDCRLTLVALGLVLCAIGSAFGQPAGSDPVEELRLTLRAPLTDPIKRDRAVKEQIWHLTSLSDLRRAVVLGEWRDEDQDLRVAAVDRPNRVTLARRFEHAVRDVLEHGDGACRLAVLTLLAEMGTTVHGVGTRHGITRAFGPDLVGLAKRGEATVRTAALGALGQVDPEPDVALPAFRELLAAGDEGQRRAAADGLAAWMRTLAQLATRDSSPDAVQVTRAEFVTVGQAVVPLAGGGLTAAQLEIRRRSAETLGHAASTLHTWLLAARSPGTALDAEASQRRTAVESAELLPLIVALKEQQPALAHALVDTDAEVRFLAGRALEDLAILLGVAAENAIRPARMPAARRTALVTPADAVRPSSFIPASSSRGAEELRGTVQALAAQLGDASVETRRAALETLEILGPDAVGATPELVTALGDQDKFVRWAAARTLGKLGPITEDAVVPALALLLTDADLDVRQAAATALQRLGTAAKAAAPDLRRTVGATDAELRVAAIRALGAVSGPDVQAAIPDLTAALGDADARVRQVAAQALGSFGPVAGDAVPALRQALQDERGEVQTAAGEALLNILRPGKE